MRYIWLAMLILLTLVGCSAFDSDDDGGDAGAVVDPVQEDSVIQWDRSPSNIVFRSEITGNRDEFYRLNEIPLCTIYGDNHIVWTVTGSSNITQVLHDRLTDEKVEQFVFDLTFGYRIYEYDAQANLASTDETEPVVEQMTLHVNDLVHITDAFGGWDYEYFEEIYNLCATLSETPVIYEPDGAWLSAQEIEYNTDAPSIGWDEGGQGIDLAELAAGDPIWITGNTVRLIWELLQNSSPDAQFEQGAGTYQIALQVPNITLDAPQPPDES